MILRLAVLILFSYILFGVGVGVYRIAVGDLPKELFVAVSFLYSVLLAIVYSVNFVRTKRHCSVGRPNGTDQPP